MRVEIRSALAELNRAFYARFAGDFALTRQSWPPGFRSILPYLTSSFNVVDLGCGNGRLLRFLHAEGWRGRYVGLDSSQHLLTLAESAATSAIGITARFVQADLLDSGWPAQLGRIAPGSVAALAVLHHIPGSTSRARFMIDAAALLEPDGLMVISTWQFLTSPRLQRHILPWSTAGLSETDVEPGDYLLTWGQNAAGQRYCAFIDEAELLRLASSAGLEPVATFRADGLERNLNLYGVFRQVPG